MCLAGSETGPGWVEGVTRIRRISSEDMTVGSLLTSVAGKQKEWGTRNDVFPGWPVSQCQAPHAIPYPPRPHYLKGTFVTSMSAWPGYLCEMQGLRPGPEGLHQNRHFHSTLGDSHATGSLRSPALCGHCHCSYFTGQEPEAQGS